MKSVSVTGLLFISLNEGILSDHTVNKIKSTILQPGLKIIGLYPYSSAL